MEGRWIIYPDGPDGRVAHFYADGNERPVHVVPVNDEAIARAVDHFVDVRGDDDSEQVRQMVYGVVRVVIDGLRRT